jgi:hypothetical protein
VTGPAASTWVPKSVIASGRDVIDADLDIAPGQSFPDLEVHFTDRKTELSGTFRDAVGHAVTEYSVFVFTTDRTKWRQGSRWIRMPAKPGSDGRFSVAGLPPGEYFVAALGRFDLLEWFTSEFMDQVAGAAITVTLREGDKTVQDLRVR